MLDAGGVVGEEVRGIEDVGGDGGVVERFVCE